MTITKYELLKTLDGEKRVIITALNFSYIVSAHGWESQFSEFTLSPGMIDLEIDSSRLCYVIPRPADLVPLYRAEEFLNVISMDLIRVTIRNAISQFSVQIENFCKGDGLRQLKWEQALWRPLARAVRNAVSHDFRFNFFNEHTKKLSPDVRFTFPSGRVFEIKNTQHGMPLTGDNMPLDVIFQLLDVMRDFVDKDL